MRKADIVTLTGGALASLSLVLALLGKPVLGLRVLIASYIADVLDGWVARRYDSPDPRGQLLDRSLDRFSQIIAPLTLFTVFWAGTFSTTEKMFLGIYAATMIPYSFYRLAYRRVASLTHFPGAPLFTHTLLMVGSIIGEVRVNPLLLLLLAALSILPVRYPRKLPGRGRKGSPSPALIPRLVILAVIALIPYKGLIGWGLGVILVFSALLYALLGWIPGYVFREDEDR
ncbi:MAG: CDP-alcohol phosphatidyltransferase family protein [Desulfurococcales archaeon]|nr:CDP-alcohol phosphatidyltransferase family protein [Desulfurococcales archaeon]